MKRAANLIRATCTSPARPAVAPMTKQTIARTTATATATRVQQQQQELEEVEEAAGWTKIMTSIGQVSHFVYEANKMASQPSGTRQAEGGEGEREAGGRRREKE